jgi:carboxylesterase type B
MHVDIDTDQGPVRGLQRADHQAFLGIPFAEPPVDALRFAAPGPGGGGGGGGGGGRGARAGRAGA